VTSTPAVDDGVAHYDDWQGGLHAVGLADGRLRWTTHVAVQDGPLAALNSSPAVVGNLVFVSTGDGRVVAVTRRTGKVRWTTVLDTHFASTLYSSPAVAGHTLVVGVSSAQNFFAGPYDFRGSIVALDTRTGRILWRTFVMCPDVDGTGGSVWSSAAIDRSRGVAYIGTGQAYAPPAGPLNDALLALRIRDGSWCGSGSSPPTTSGPCSSRLAARTTTSAPPRTCGASRSTSHSETGPVVSQRTARPRSQRLAIRCHSA
jgi:outer membrane protein assembly factor BamB